MIAELVLAVACVGLANGPEMNNLNNITKLSHRMVYRRWDTTGDGRADLMTAHRIPENLIESYRERYNKGETFDVVAAKRPLYWWVDSTGRDSWDRIYLDENGDGHCTLYASRVPEQET